MQSISVTVTVVDTKGEPIIGANVIEKGTTNGGITDLDGVSKLNVSPVLFCKYHLWDILLKKLRQLR